MYDRKIGASMRERKKLACGLEIKSLDAEGRFAGYASVFGVLDNQKDIILRGAFADTIRGRVAQIKLLWQHQPDEPIGVFNAIFEDKRGLYVEGQLLLDVERAREAFALLKSGAVTGLSIGYSPVRYTIDPDTGVRKLAEVDLWEVSLVTFPANEQAGVTVVKSRALREYTKGELLQLNASAERRMEELWERRDEYFAVTDSMPVGRDAIAAECKSVRAECDWIKTYSTLLQIKMHADALLALRKDDLDFGDDSGGDSSGGFDLDSSDSGDDSGDEGWANAWQNEARVPAGNPNGGQWTSDGAADPFANPNGQNLGPGMQEAANNTTATDAQSEQNKLPTQNVGNIIFNETRSLSSTPDADINDARTDIAYMIRNGEDWGNTYGIERPRTADDFITGNIPDIEMTTYNAAQTAATNADAQIVQGGQDPTSGAIYMSIVGDNHTILNGKTLTLSTGPFRNSFTRGDVPYKTVYINFSK